MDSSPGYRALSMRNWAIAMRVSSSQSAYNVRIAASVNSSRMKVRCFWNLSEVGDQGGSQGVPRQDVDAAPMTNAGVLVRSSRTPGPLIPTTQLAF
jgi:hypothetical protein